MKTKVAIGFVLLAMLIGVGVAYANSTVDLQPTYRLMNGEVELGVVYSIDGGWLALTEEDTVPFCGCGEAACYDGTEVVPSDTEEPKKEKTPTNPTPTNTDTPGDTPEPSRKCNRGLGNNEEGCDPGNSGGKPGAAGEDNEPDGPPGQRDKPEKTKKPK